ncbi:MAG: isoleucyl-tRNA synthetase [Frankiaceae bacterium]|nr:isoleucyl-tRNA synthetase [Frankiaceae bacterium]
MHETLLTLTQLLAPFVPFLAEEVWDRLHGTGDSVHLTSWPVAGAVDETLSRQMLLVRRLVELGRATRAGSGVKTRQPLARALVAAQGWPDLPAELRAQVAEELNVADVDALGESAGLVDVTVKPNFRALGARFGKETPKVAAAVQATDPVALAAALANGAATVTVDGTGVQVTPDEVVVTETPREGWAVASEGGATLALDLTITPELRLAGLARDAVRTLQESRKNAGLDVSDRIELWWDATGELAEALAAHGASVAEEVLAVRFERGHPPIDMAHHEDRDLGLTWWLRAAGQ